MKLTPDDFKISLIEEAHRLRHFAIARSSRSDLDSRTSMWVIREEAWREFQMSKEFMTHTLQVGGNSRKELLGLPVRLTYDDDKDVPMIQLVMEPMMHMPRKW